MYLVYLPNLDTHIKSILNFNITSPNNVSITNLIDLTFCVLTMKYVSNNFCIADYVHIK